jgi:acyl-CoA thioester hydrolase
MDEAFVIDIRVQYPDCDPMGVVHHAVYPLWFERGRIELLRSVGVAYADLEKKGLFMAVIELSVRYHKPARYDEWVQVATTCTRAGGVRIQHEYKVHRDGLLLATGSSTLACLDREGRPQAVPDSLSFKS